MALPSRFLRKAALAFSFSFSALAALSSTRALLAADTRKREKFFSVLYRRHVVKGFGSDYLTAVGAACVRASFMAVEI